MIQYLKPILVKCPRCGFSSSDLNIFECPRCGEPLLIINNTEVKVSSIAKVRSLKPYLTKYVSLGEGLTPIIKLGSDFLKLENLNPTGSFKDRGASLAISHVVSMSKYGIVIEDSSGNAGISVAAYASYSGIKARIYVPSDIPRGKYLLLRALGADVILAGTRNDAHKAAISDKDGLYIGHVINPYFIEGMKDIALEAVKQLGTVPSYVVTPVASGTLILGLWKGFKELRELGVLEKVPRLIAVQACGYSTLKDKVETIEVKCTEKSRLADALRLTIVPRINQIVNAIKETEGLCLIIGDDELLNSLRTLWRAGITAEPSSAVTYAAMRYLRECSLVKNGDIVLGIITGSGLKYVDRLELIV